MLRAQNNKQPTGWIQTQAPVIQSQALTHPSEQNPSPSHLTSVYKIGLENHLVQSPCFRMSSCSLKSLRVSHKME